MIDQKFYNLMGVSPDANIAEIKAAYKVKKNAVLGSERSGRGEREYEIDRAYDMLFSEAKRHVFPGSLNLKPEYIIGICVALVYILFTIFYFYFSAGNWGEKLINLAAGNLFMVGFFWSMVKERFIYIFACSSSAILLLISFKGIPEVWFQSTDRSLFLFMFFMMVLALRSTR